MFIKLRKRSESAEERIKLIIIDPTLVSGSSISHKLLELSARLFIRVRGWIKGRLKEPREIEL